MMLTATRIFAFFVTLTLLAFSACKPTVENQSAAWTSNTASVDKLSAQYPGLKPALSERLAAAQADKAKADGLGGEAAAEQLQAANRKLMTGFVGQLAGLDKELEALREQTVKTAAAATDPSSRMAAKLAADDATKTIDRIRETLKRGAADDATATALMAKITADLAAAKKAVGTVEESDKDKTDKKEADAKAEADQAAADKQEADAKVADWKCEYCGSLSKHDHLKCGSCGAPRPGTTAEPPAPTK